MHSGEIFTFDLNELKIHENHDKVLKVFNYLKSYDSNAFDKQQVHLDPIHKEAYISLLQKHFYDSSNEEPSFI